MQREYAKSNRKNQTPAERRLWNFIRNRQRDGQKFIREMVIGGYIADFVCREKKVIIELDGGQHAEKTVVRYDEKRDAFLRSNGYKVIRIWNHEIFENMDGVLEFIREAVSSVV